jgi:hypothetical protein
MTREPLAGDGATAFPRERRGAFGRRVELPAGRPCLLRGDGTLRRRAPAANAFCAASARLRDHSKLNVLLENMENPTRYAQSPISER